MRKFILTLLISALASIPNVAFSNEMEDDYLDIATNYCIIGEYDTAVEYLDKILKINPGNTQANDLKKGLLHVIAQDKKTFVTSVNPYIKEAQEYKRNGDFNSETESLITGTKSENAYLAYYYLGNLYADTKQYAKAIDAYNKSLSARADFSQAYLALAVTLNDYGHFESALNPLDKYLTYNSDDDFAYNLKARIEFQLGKFGNAQIDNNKALSLNECPEYLFDRAKILYKTGEYTKAKELFSKLLTDIQTSKIYEYMAMCDYAQQNYMEALNNLNKAIILSDNDQYLENKYNEIKNLLESQKDETQPKETN